MNNRITAITDKATLNQMKIKYGQEVVSYQDTYALKGQYASNIIPTALENLSKRNIPNISVETFSNNGFKYTVITQSLGSKNCASFAVRVDAYGNDLLIDFHHYEKAVTHGTKMHIIGWTMCFVGALLVAVGVGLIPVIAGFWMGLAQYHFPSGSPERQASQLMFQTVLATFGDSMQSYGISQDSELPVNF